MPVIKGGNSKDGDRYITTNNNSDNKLAIIKGDSNRNNRNNVAEDSDIKEGTNKSKDVKWYNNKSKETRSKLSSDY
jgi:hypothetical protein